MKGQCFGVQYFKMDDGRDRCIVHRDKQAFITASREITKLIKIPPRFFKSRIFERAVCTCRPDANTSWASATVHRCSLAQLEIYCIYEAPTDVFLMNCLNSNDDDDGGDDLNVVSKRTLEFISRAIMYTRGGGDENESATRFVCILKMALSEQYPLLEECEVKGNIAICNDICILNSRDTPEQGCDDNDLDMRGEETGGVGITGQTSDYTDQEKCLNGGDTRFNTNLFYGTDTDTNNNRNSKDMNEKDTLTSGTNFNDRDISRCAFDEETIHKRESDSMRNDSTETNHGTRGRRFYEDQSVSPRSKNVNVEGSNEVTSNIKQGTCKYKSSVGDDIVSQRKKVGIISKNLHDKDKMPVESLSSAHKAAGNRKCLSVLDSKKRTYKSILVNNDSGERKSVVSDKSSMTTGGIKEKVKINVKVNLKSDCGFENQETSTRKNENKSGTNSTCRITLKCNANVREKLHNPERLDPKRKRNQNEFFTFQLELHFHNANCYRNWSLYLATQYIRRRYRPDFIQEASFDYRRKLGKSTVVSIRCRRKHEIPIARELRFRAMTFRPKKNLDEIAETEKVSFMPHHIAAVSDPSLLQEYTTDDYDAKAFNRHQRNRSNKSDFHRYKSSTAEKKFIIKCYNCHATVDKVVSPGDNCVSDPAIDPSFSLMQCQHHPGFILTNRTWSCCGQECDRDDFLKECDVSHQNNGCSWGPHLWRNTPQNKRSKTLNRRIHDKHVNLLGKQFLT